MRCFLPIHLCEIRSDQWCILLSTTVFAFLYYHLEGRQSWKRSNSTHSGWKDGCPTFYANLLLQNIPVKATSNQNKITDVVVSLISVFCCYWRIHHQVGYKNIFNKSWHSWETFNIQHSVLINEPDSEQSLHSIRGGLLDEYPEEGLDLVNIANTLPKKGE